MSDSPASPRTAGRCREFRLDLSTEEIDRDIDVFAAFANETRYRILRLLHDHDEVCVCDIEASLPASQSAISHALSKLHSVGLVDRRKEGRWRHYRNTPLAEALLATADAERGDGNGR